MKLSGTYKGYEIEYLDHIKQFRLLVSEEFEYMNNDLGKVTTYVDRMLKKEFKRIDAFYLRGDYTPVYVEITGIAADEGVWLTEKEPLKEGIGNPSRRKRLKYHGTLYIDTGDNHAFLKILTEKDRHEKKARNEKRGLLERMKKFTDKSE